MMNVHRLARHLGLFISSGALSFYSLTDFFFLCHTENLRLGTQKFLPEDLCSEILRPVKSQSTSEGFEAAILEIQGERTLPKYMSKT